MNERRINFNLLSQIWHGYKSDNEGLIKHRHTSLYFFLVDACNRFQWAEEFVVPSVVGQAASSIASNKTYLMTLRELEEFGFISILSEDTKPSLRHTLSLIVKEEEGVDNE